ncbi:MAG: hypothetical protein V4726_00225 [Verrucomicrobiota bacterium]
MPEPPLFALGNWTALLLCGVLCAGCSGVSHRALDAAADKKARGFRYYDISPYLVVQTDGNGGLESSLKYLPDLTKLREAHPFQFLASNTSKFTFSEGVLTEGVSEGDGTAVPSAFLDAATKVAAAAVKAQAFDDPSAQRAADGGNAAPKVYIFKIKQNGNTWELLGDAGFEPFHNTIY